MTKDQIPADDVLQVVEVDDGATIVIIHDAFLYGRGATVTSLDRTRDSVAHTAAKHAATRHTPRTATNGGQP